jgi:homospermidine synthase
MARRTASVCVVAPKPNLLVLGASGNVARAFLRRLGGRRVHFGRLVLLDKNDRVRDDPVLEHDRLDYQFIRRRLRLPTGAAAYQRLLRDKQIHVVLDLSDMDTLPVLAATDAAGVSYISTSLNDDGLGVAPLMEKVYPHRHRPHRAAHVLCAGMNPGIVNIWVHHGVRRYGLPREVVHFEYDTSMTANGWLPLITWSRREFLTESVWEPTGRVEAGKPVILRTNALQNREDMRDVLQPVLPLRRYPRGMLVLHEENLSLGQRLGVSSKFLYAIHPKTMAYLNRRYRRHGTVTESDLVIGDNTSIPLEGEDTIGVCLQYPRRRVYYLHTLENRAVSGANATCTQVAVGVYAALFTLIRNRLAPQLYFPGDLYDTLYAHIVFCNMRVERFVFGRRKRSWVLREHIANLRPRFLNKRQPFVI